MKKTVATVPYLQGIRVYNVDVQSNENVLALGITPVKLPYAEVFPVLEFAAIDSSAVLFNSCAHELDFIGLVEIHVDYLYKPRIYAVLIFGIQKNLRSTYEGLGRYPEIRLLDFRCLLNCLSKPILTFIRFGA